MIRAFNSMSQSQIAAIMATQEFSAAQLAATLSGTGFEASQIANQMALMGYNKEAVIAALMTTGLSEQEAAAAVAGVSFAAAQGTATVALKAFGVALANVVKGLIAFLTTNPVGWVILAAGAIFGIVKAYDALTVSAEEATEQMNESFSEFEEATSTLESLNKELETTNERIAELEAKDTLTFVEESELQKLRESVELLQIQADLAEKKAIREGKEAAEDTVTAYRKNFKNEISADAIDEYIANSTSTGNNAILFSDESDISALLAGMEQMKKLRDELDKDSTTYEEDYEHFQGIIDDTTDTIWEQVEVLSDYKSKLESIPYDQLSTDQQNALDEINSAIELIYTSLDPGKWKEMQWNGIVNNEQYADDVKKLKELAATTEITASTIRSEFPEVAQACSDAGLKISDVVDNLNASFDRATDEIGNKKIRILSSLFDMPDVDFKSGNLLSNGLAFGADILKQYQEYADYIESLSDDEIELAYNIVVTSKIDGLDELKTAIEAAGIEDIVSADKLQEYEELFSEYQSVVNEARLLGIDLSNTVYGNIDTNNRQILEWTDENLATYKDAIESWGATVDEMKGSISTVFGSSSEYDGVEIAFSPILQTENGPVLLDSHTVDEYIWGLIDKAGEGWTSEDLLRLDTEGLEFDGQIVKNLLADIGDTAIHTGEAMHFTGETGAVNEMYDALKESADEAGISIEALMYYFEHSSSEIAVQATNIRNSLKGMWDSEDFADTKTSLMQMANTLDGITGENIKDLAKESSTLKSILDQDGMSAEFLAKVLQTVADGEDGFTLITESALLLNQALEGMVRDFDQVTEAKARYDAAMNVPEKDEEFKSYAEAFKVLNEQFEAGTTNSNAFWAAAEFLFGSEQLQTWGWTDGLDEIYAAMQKNVGIFEDADSAGAGFLDRLYEIAENGKVLDENGNVLATIEKLSDGSFTFDIDATSIDEIAQKLGITEEAALSCLKALSMWGNIDFYNVDEVLDAIEKIGLSSDSLEGTAVNVDALTDQLISLGYTNKDIYDLLQTLQNVEGITFLSASSDVDTLTNSLTNLGLATGDGIEVKVNTESLSILMEQLNFTKEDAQGLITKLDEADGITLTNAKGEVHDLKSALEFIDTLDFATVEGKVNDLEKSIDGVDESSTDNAQTQLEAIGTSAETAEGKVEQLQTKINGLTGKTVTVSVDVKRKNSLLSMLGFANGTKNAPDGVALTGEEGAELVKSGDQAYLAGANGPELVHLNKGDTVYTADETKEILKSGKYISGTIPAYSNGYKGGASGTVNPHKTYKSVLPSSKSSKGTSTASEIKEAAEATKSLEEQLEDTLKGMKETIDDIIGDYEHSIMILEHKKADPNEIINIYKQMQEAVHQQAEEYRKLGLAENSDYIQDLQKQWWEYQDSIQDLIIETYEKSVAEHENAITLNENWLDKAITNKDFSGITKYTSDIISHYKAMQDEIHQQAEYYRSLGYSDTSDEISKLSDLWWDYYDKIANTSANAWKQVVDNANDAVDEITGLYDTLKDAAQEYADSGFITIDTLQEICSWGIQYLAYLKDENGQLVINEESLQRVIAARTEQMAVETALNYVQQLRQALADNDVVALMNLTTATNAASSSTWDLVYAQLQLLGLDSEQYGNALNRINALRSLSDVAITSIGKVDGAAKKMIQEQSDALSDLLKYVEEMIKQEVKNQVKALEDQVDAYKEIVDLQKKSLDLEKEKDDYTKSVKDKQKEIADLRKQIYALDLDDSREAAAKKDELQEQLSEKINDLADYQSDHAYDAASDMLDDMADSYEKEKQKEIDILENTISSEEKLYQLAIDRINNHWDTLYQDLINWNYEYGSVTNDEITSAWNNASAAVQQYGSYLNAVLETQRQIAAYEASSNSYTIGGSSDGNSQGGSAIGKTGNYDTSGSQTLGQVKNIVHQMKANSAAHHSADTAGKARLNKANLDLGKQLTSLIGRTAVRGDDGVWYLDRVGGPKLYETYPYSTYHGGGIAGDDPTLKQKEIMAKLEKGEAIITEKQQDSLYRILDSQETMLAKFGKLAASANDAKLFESRMGEQIRQDAQQAQSMVENSSFNITVTAPVQVYPLQKLDQSEIKKLTKDISKHTITALNDSFIKRGKTRTSNPLKP